MTVYVDSLMISKPSTHWPYTTCCHLKADSVEELHAFAARLGIQFAWFQGHHPNPVMWHYDLTKTKRAEAIRLGAAPLSGAENTKRIFELTAKAKREAGGQE